MDLFFTERIKAICSNLKKASSIADIGCDHGYSSIYIIQNKIANSVIACDINPLPLKKARENIIKYKQENNIKTKQSDGFKEIKIGEIDSAIISGMGGMLIIEILKKSPNLVKTLNQIVVQPQHDICSVRKYIHHIGFYIENEQILKEDNKYYNIISAMLGFEKYTEKEYMLGKILIDKKDTILKEYIEQQLNIWDNIIQKLINSNTGNSLSRLNELNKKYKIYKEVLNAYNK